MTTTPVRSTMTRPFQDGAARTNHAPVKHLLTLDGGAVRAGAVAKRFGVPVPVVEQLRRAGRLLALPDTSGYQYPAWQFEGRGQLTGLPTVLEALRDRDPWQQLQFLLLPNAELDGQRPLDLLRHGALREVLLAARSLSGTQSLSS